MASTLSYLRLLRAPNVFTAVADIAMGFLFVTHSLVPVGGLALLLVATCGLYLAGMVLNDVFDVEVDRQERPQRPIPSGEISLGRAKTIGFGLLVVGVVAGVFAGLFFSAPGVGRLRSGTVAIILALSVLIYDGGVKKTFFGAIAMGLCRTCNVLLGMSLFPAVGRSELLTFSVSQWAVAGG
ncbi:MAG: UbiA family prenyltransferase, partial [Planctomycetales bacterium]|nr:UbiA family prenyltransferase [Planctomycetales bacterium]